MASDPFFSGGAPTTVSGAIGLLFAAGAWLIRQMWKRNEDLEKKNDALQESRIQDNKDHTAEIIQATVMVHKTGDAMRAAVEALRQKPKKPESD